jgi:hypothetical protein
VLVKVSGKEEMVEKVDLRTELKHLYKPSAKEVTVVDVPEMSFLMVDGEGDPNTSEWYGQAVEALYAVSYALKFMVKKGESGVDYAVMPLEGLWWADDMSRFSTTDKGAWKWTMMIVQPEEYVTETLFDEARQSTAKKKDLPALASMRFEAFQEGRAAQIMHKGPFAEEGPNIEKIHRFIQERGHERRGKHHEIYLGDPRRTAPERFKTVLRQPFE